MVQELVSGRAESIAKRCGALNVKLLTKPIYLRFPAEQHPKHSKPTVEGLDGRIEPTGRYFRRVGVSVAVDAIHQDHSPPKDIAKFFSHALDCAASNLKISNSRWKPFDAGGVSN